MADLVATLRAELDALEALLPAAMDAQWSAPPVSRPREDTSERMKNRRSDPTGDLATDPHRLILRKSVVTCASALARGTVALRQVRADVSGALAPWLGEDTEVE